MDTCKHCGKKLIDDRGSKDSKYLVILDAPDDQDVKTGVALSGRVGELLKREMMFARIDYTKCLYTVIWRHPPLEKKDDPGLTKEELSYMNSECERLFLDRVYGKMNNKEGVLLMGAGALSMLTTIPSGIMSVSSLDVSPHLVKEIQCGHVTAMPNPAQGLHQGIGEIRLALSKFRERMVQ